MPGHTLGGGLRVKRAGICVWAAGLDGSFLPLLTDDGRVPLPEEENDQLQEGASVTKISLINARSVEDIDRVLWLGRSREMKMELAPRLPRPVCGWKDVASPGTCQGAQSWVPACILVLKQQEPTPTQ